MPKLKKETKIEYKKYQQGDVVMYKLNDDDFEKYSNGEKSDKNLYQTVSYNGQQTANAILAFGEVTGHTHRIEMSEMLKDAGVTLHMGYNQKPGVDVPKSFQVINKPATIIHEEHDPVTIPPGNYVVKIVREFNHITRRAQYVAD